MVVDLLCRFVRLGWIECSMTPTRALRYINTYRYSERGQGVMMRFHSETMIRVERINNFLLFHAYFTSMPHVSTILFYRFEAFYWTKLLTRCPMPVPCFCPVFVAESYF